MFSLKLVLALAAMGPFSSSAFAHSTDACVTLEEQANLLVKRLNSEFGKNVVIRFLEESPPDEQGNTVLRKPMLLDANISNQDNQGRPLMVLPKPCKMGEHDLPSYELWSFFVAHEFAHIVIDRDADEWACYRSAESRKSTAEDFLVLDEMSHVNVDIFALKLLSFLKIDPTMAVRDFGRYLTEYKSMLGDSYEHNRKRVSYLTKTGLTDFNSGHEFVAGAYFGGLPEIKIFLKREFPHSEFLDDISAFLVTENPICSLYKEEKQNQSLRLWKEL